MTDTRIPTEQDLLHLVDRIRRGTVLPAEVDQLAAGIRAMAARLKGVEAAVVTSPPPAPLPEFIDVSQYRHDHGHQAWAWRCWGDGGCDGWLSLDNSSEETAQRRAARHVTEAHAPADEQRVEQWARAFAGAAHLNPKRNAPYWDDLDEADRRHFREQARRVLAAGIPPKDQP